MTLKRNCLCATPPDILFTPNNVSMLTISARLSYRKAAWPINGLTLDGPTTRHLFYRFGPRSIQGD